MCDTLCAPGPRGMVFAKNSDRPLGEIQVAWPFGRRGSAGCTLRTQYLTIGDTGADATFLSCPTWCWGAEHGVNEHGVAIGNERVATTHDAASAPPALIGMDLVRLGLERARSADEAVDVIAALLDTVGQGGIADAAHQAAYDSSFLIADSAQAVVVETAGSEYAVAPASGATAISNRITIGTDWTRGSRHLTPGEDFDRFRDAATDTRFADVRLAASRRFLAGTPPGGLTAVATAAHLRDHGAGPWGAPGTDGPGPPAAPARRRRLQRGQRVHARPWERCDRRLHDRRAPGGHRRRGAAPASTWRRVARAPASTFPPSRARRPGPRRSSPSSSRARSCGTPPMRSASTSRLILMRCAAVRAVLQDVEDELWAEADDVLERPERWRVVGASWGARALQALRACIP